MEATEHSNMNLILVALLGVGETKVVDQCSFVADVRPSLPATQLRVPDRSLRLEQSRLPQLDCSLLLALLALVTHVSESCLQVWLPVLQLSLVFLRCLILVLASRTDASPTFPLPSSVGSSPHARLRYPWETVLCL